MVADEATLGWLLPAARSYKVDAMYYIQHYVPGDSTFGAETGGRHHPTGLTHSVITRPHDFHYSPRHPAFLVTLNHKLQLWTSRSTVEALFLYRRPRSCAVARSRSNLPRQHRIRFMR